MKITTTHVHPPIPIRKWDWCAYDESTYDGAPDAGHQVVGWGATEQEAVNALLEEISDGEWRADEYWHCINGDWISTSALRNWCYHNMGDSPSRHVDVVRMCHIRAYAERVRT